MIRMTATASLLDSCTTIFSRQGITLHSDSQNKTAIYHFVIEESRITNLNNSLKHWALFKPNTLLSIA